jgi:hypothetical protein
MWLHLLDRHLLSDVFNCIVKHAWFSVIEHALSSCIVEHACLSLDWRANV